MLLEEIIHFLANLDRSSPLVPFLNDRLITLLWNDLAHPPATYLSLPHPRTGSDLQPKTGAICPFANSNYPYHTATGQFNNPFNPGLGSAGFSYARTVNSAHCVLPESLPDAGLVFDTLFARPPTEDIRKHPGGLSSLFFAFANLVIHSLFSTSPAPGENIEEATMNAVSSYLDLSPLYGSSQEELSKVRRMDGTGRLWEDCWADERIGYMPPSSVGMVILFCRNHNYIASMLLSINEGGTYLDPSTLSVEGNQDSLDKQDSQIFERARLINCHHFMQVIITDYIGAILGLTREGNDFTLDPLREMSENITPGGSKVPRATGNVVSAEFNMLYRWHAALSESDTLYTKGLFHSLWPDKSPEDVTPSEFYTSLSAMMRQGFPDPRVRPLPLPNSPPRQADGSFPTPVIASIIQNATHEAAHPFGARCIPTVMRVVEIVGIQQARRWGLGTLNELRKVLGLKEYATFYEWNPDPEIADAAQTLYGNVENLELYPGLMAEATKKPMPGAGLCPGFTISRAILSDAISLVRGDRWLSVERTPKNMTAWGYQDTQLNFQNGAFGGMLSKLIFRTLPGEFEENSAYALFPFIEPSAMKAGLANSRPELVNTYDWDQPRHVRPPVPPKISNGHANGHANEHTNGHANGYANGHVNMTYLPSPPAPKSLPSAALKGISFKETFSTPSLSMGAMKGLLGGRRIWSYKPEVLLKTLIFPSMSGKLMESRLESKIRKDSYTCQVLDQAGEMRSLARVDLVPPIMELPIIYVASQWIPLPSDLGPKEFQNLYDHIYSHPYQIEKGDGYELGQAARSAARSLMGAVKAEIHRIHKQQYHASLTNTVKAAITGKDNPEKEKQSFITLFMKQFHYKSDDDISNELFGFLISVVPLWSLILVNLVASSFQKENREKMESLLSHYRGGDNESLAALEKYCLDITEKTPPVSQLARTCQRSFLYKTQEGEMNTKAGEDLLVDLTDIKGLRDERGDEEEDIYHLFDYGDVLKRLVLETAPRLLDSVFSKSNVQLFGSNGLQRFRAPATPYESPLQYDWMYQGRLGKISRWPQNFTVMYEQVEGLPKNPSHLKNGSL